MSFVAIVVHTDIPYNGKQEEAEVGRVKQLIASGTPLSFVRTDDEGYVRRWAAGIAGAQRCDVKPLKIKEARECLPADKYNGGDGGDICQECQKKQPFKPSGKNVNCIEDWICPKCGNEDKFVIRATTLMTITDDGTDELDGALRGYDCSVDWDIDDMCVCPECEWVGKIRDFDTSRDNDSQVMTFEGGTE
jgi:hypothetical protein